MINRTSVAHLDIINQPHERAEGLRPCVRRSNRIHGRLGENKRVP